MIFWFVHDKYIFQSKSMGYFAYCYQLLGENNNGTYSMSSGIIHVHNKDIINPITLFSVPVNTF